ncbi:hypothetical protein LR48_Vigan2441s000100 [Vigna angularis]|nr:hypothetical protein LR48_Vigan2441s000100 [Vigna angularis]
MRMEKGHVENRKEKLEEIDLQQWEKRVSWFHGVVGIIWVQSVHIRQQSLTQSLTGLPFSCVKVKIEKEWLMYGQHFVPHDMMCMSHALTTIQPHQFSLSLLKPLFSSNHNTIPISSPTYQFTTSFPLFSNNFARAIIIYRFILSHFISNTNNFREKKKKKEMSFIEH